jgi:hypothetical protein
MREKIQSPVLEGLNLNSPGCNPGIAQPCRYNPEGVEPDPLAGCVRPVQGRAAPASIPGLHPGLFKFGPSGVVVRVVMLALFGWLISGGLLFAADDLSFVQRDDRLILVHAGQPIAHYIFKEEKILRPYFAHVHTADGIQVTRRHPPVAGEDAVDHATMHPGLWLAFGDLAGHDFWRNRGTIRHDRFTQAPAAGGDALTFSTASSMLTSNGTILAQLDSRFTLGAVSNGFLLTWRASITPAVDGFYFGDQEEMGFGVRVATALAEKNGGTILTSDGARGAKASWGQTAAWSDCSGVISNRAVGIAILTAPENFRSSWFHNRDYGLMVANPFGRKAFTKGEPSRVAVAKGQAFTLRAGFFIHSTPGGTPAEIASAYQQFNNTGAFK